MSALPRMSVNVPLLTQPWRASVSFTAPGPGGAQLLCTARREVGFTQAHGGGSWERVRGVSLEERVWYWL